MANPSATIPSETPQITILDRRHVTELFTGSVPHAFEWFRSHPEHSNAYVFVDKTIIDLPQLKQKYEGKF